MSSGFVIIRVEEGERDGGSVRVVGGSGGRVAQGDEEIAV